MATELARLLQLASPVLPVGAYSYSQGLEAAIEAGDVRDAAGAARWIGDVLTLSVSRFEVPILARLHAAWQAGDAEAVHELNARFLASRETAELRAETVQMGYSLRKLLVELELGERAALEAIEQPAFPAVFACAAAAWSIPARETLVAYLWSWCENQVMAAVKAVPLGQTEGQKMLAALGARLCALADAALAAEDDALCNFAPRLALLSSRHETQYTRLFRS